MAFGTLSLQKMTCAILSLSPSLQTLMVNNGIGLDELFARAGAAELDKVPDPISPPGARAEPVTMIVASAAVIASITPLLISLLKAITQRPIVAVSREQNVVLDGKGEVVRDENGKPTMAWRETSVLLEPTHVTDTIPSVGVKGFGIELTLGK